MPESLTTDALTKRYGGNTVLPSLDLQVGKGEFFTLLGPSGCGKTTLLRLIAGFEQPDDGAIRMGTRDITQLPPHKRDIGMVFQDYALFPHMTVEKNVDYGLGFRPLTRGERERRVREMLEMAHIAPLAARLPEQLSGGQQQRVALARAMAIRPSLLLMDEPLSNLDAELRLEMRTAIRQMQKATGVTTIYVTHDQEEALAVSDRIAIMERGRILQTGTPQEVYLRPADIAVAKFLGHTNLLRARTEGGAVLVNGVAIAHRAAAEDGEAVAGVRPEGVAISRAGTTGAIRGRILRKTFMGARIDYVIDVGGISPDGTLKATSDAYSGNAFDENDEVSLTFRPEAVNLFAPDGKSLDPTRGKDAP